jgi:hypothetical protein
MGRAAARFGYRRGDDLGSAVGIDPRLALARSLFRKGASFTAAMAFEIASTNMVVELGIIMALLRGGSSPSGSSSAARSSSSRWQRSSGSSCARGCCATPEPTPTVVSPARWKAMPRWT